MSGTGALAGLAAIGWWSAIAAAATIAVPADQPTLQAAIDAAQIGDVVLVADGVYTGAGNKNLAFTGRAVTIRSEHGPAACVVDCEDDGRAIFMSGQNGVAIVVEGLTFTRGYVDHASPGGRKGGAAIIQTSSPAFVNCVFDDNHGHTGGAIYCTTAAAPTFVNCRFTNQVYDGGLEGDVDIHLGGALYARNGAAPVMINCTIADNACAPGPDHIGGGVQVSGATTTLALRNCVLWGNSATFGAQISATEGAVVTVRFCDVQGGAAAVHLDGGAAVVWDAGNIDADPRFVGGAAGGYRPSAGAPVIDAGESPALPEGIMTDAAGAPRFVDDPASRDTGIPGSDHPVVDMGAHEFQAGALACPTDLDGDAQTAFSDLLALLAAWGPCAGCRADLDGDGAVGFADLLVLLAEWGSC
jgi:hypothetical protein